VFRLLALFAPDEASARMRLRARMERPEPPSSVASPLDDLVRSVCVELAIAETDVRGGRRSRLASRARALICRRALRECGLGVMDVARALGLSHAAVSQAVRRSLRDK
jgi:chromosomal replication initiation ATPase DnaA